MAVPVDPPRAFAPLFAVERARLGELLRSLSTAEWRTPSPCPGWDVLGLATHILGGDLVLLAGQRDGHRGTPAPAGLSEPEFITWLDELQIEWVQAARRLSPRLVVDLLDWTADQVTEMIASQDPQAVEADVSWAGAAPVPRWLDQARELSERWIHRQQILQAIGKTSDLRPPLAEAVLDGLCWAYPHRLDAHRRPAGEAVEIAVTGPEVELGWYLVSDGRRWELGPSAGREVVARLRMTTEQAWRLLTNNLSPASDETLAIGDPALAAILLRTRAIIGAPK